MNECDSKNYTFIGVDFGNSSIRYCLIQPHEYQMDTFKILCMTKCDNIISIRNTMTDDKYNRECSDINTITIINNKRFVCNNFIDTDNRLCGYDYLIQNDHVNNIQYQIPTNNQCKYVSYLPEELFVQQLEHVKKSIMQHNIQLNMTYWMITIPVTVTLSRLRNIKNAGMYRYIFT